VAELFGVEIGDLPEGSLAIAFVVMVKALDPDGDLVLYERKSDGLTTWEALGMATTFADTARSRLMGAYRPGDEES